MFSLWGTTAGNIIMTFIVSMVPVIELRGAIPLGVLNGLDVGTAMIVSILGNLVPVPFIIIFINQIRLNYPNTKELQELFIRCAEYSISDVVTQKNPKNGKNEKVKLKNPEFLIQYEKTIPGGIYAVKEQLKHKYKDNEEEFRLEYINVLNKLITSSTSSNQLVVEKMMTHFCKQRIDYLINNILPVCDKNTLILAHHTDYIRYYDGMYIKYCTIMASFCDR